MVEAAAARVTGDDLRRVLDPRETQAIVMLMRNGDDEHSRRHAAARMRVDFDEFEALVASARRKVEQVKLRKAAATAVEEVRPVEDALLDAAGHGGGGLGRGCARSSVPRGLRGSVLSPAERIERDDDEEAKVATTTRRWDEIRARAAELVERAAPMSVPQRELAQVLDVSGTDFSLQVAPFLKRDPRFLREQESTGKPVEWSLVGSGAGAGPADGGSPASPGDVGSAADQTPVGPVGDGEEFPSAASERAAEAPPAASLSGEPSPPDERAGGGEAGAESDAKVAASRNGDVPPSDADGRPPSQTAPADHIPQRCAECGLPIGPAMAQVARDGDARVWHAECAARAELRGIAHGVAAPSMRPRVAQGVTGPAPFAGGGPAALPEEVRSVMRRMVERGLGGGQPDRSPRERYVDALIGKLDAMDGYEDELCDRIEAQLELLG